MNKRQTRLAKVQKEADHQHLPKQQPVQQPEQGPVQSVAPHVAYWRTQVSRSRLRPADLLVLQRTVGNRQVQRIVGQHTDSANGQQLYASAEESPGIKVQTKLAISATDDIYAQKADDRVQQIGRPLLSSHGGTPSLVQRWFTEDNSANDRKYFLYGKEHVVAVKRTNHEDIVRSAKNEMELIKKRYGPKAQEKLVYSSAEPDRWKGEKTAQLAEQVPELKQLGSTEVSITQPKSDVEKLLHAQVPQSKLKGLCKSAKYIAQKDILKSLRILGIYLHATQDYFAHSAALIHGGKDLRKPREDRSFNELENIKQHKERIGRQFTLTGPTYVLEDDPALGKERWNRVIIKTQNLLQQFLRGKKL